MGLKAQVMGEWLMEAQGVGNEESRITFKGKGLLSYLGLRKSDSVKI